MHWYTSIVTNTPTTSGTLMLATLPMILGFQLLLSFVVIDLQNILNEPICKSIAVSQKDSE